MRNKTTKKYKHNRKIRGGGNGFIDSFTGIFNKTTDTNKEMFEIKQLETILSKNMQDLTNTYESVYKKVTNLNEKINKLSNISNTTQNTNQENELQNEQNNGFFGMFGNKNKSQSIEPNSYSSTPESIVSEPYSSTPESIEPNSYSSTPESIGSEPYTLTPNFENQVAPGQQFTGGKRKSRRKHRVCNR
jgi:hypothetical protein